MNRAGKRAVTPALAITTSPDSMRLTQPVEHVAPELRRLIEKQAAMVRERRRPRPDHAAASADDRGPGRGVMRCAERRLDDQRASGRKGAGDRVDRADLKRRGRIKPRQDRRDSLGEHRFANARRPEQHQMVAAGRADLGRPPGDRLPDQIREVLHGLTPAAPARRRRRHLSRTGRVLRDLPPGLEGRARSSHRMAGRPGARRSACPASVRRPPSAPSPARPRPRSRSPRPWP